VSARYLAVPHSARNALARFEPVYGEELDDGRTVAKVRDRRGRLPDGVEVIGEVEGEVRKRVYEPAEGDLKFKARARILEVGL
jgi:hypothetical protein